MSRREVGIQSTALTLSQFRDPSKPGERRLPLASVNVISVFKNLRLTEEWFALF